VAPPLQRLCCFISSGFGNYIRINQYWKNLHIGDQYDIHKYIGITLVPQAL